MYFQYDNDNTPVGIVLNGTQYFYITNQMGDVIGITDTQGNALVQYEYDEWGKIGSITTTNNTDEENTLANINPLRYRGYYYDNETGYYYLQSRYYDANLCRFINADIYKYIISQKDVLSGANIYAYCCNNPVYYSDTDGHWVLSVGLEFEASAIWGIYGGISINFDGKGNIVIAYCAGVTFTTNVTASLYGYVSYNQRASSATSIKGWGISAGVSYSSGIKLGGSGGLNVGINDKSVTGSTTLSLGVGASLASIPYIYVRGGYTGIIYSTSFSKISSKVKSYSKKGVKIKISKKSSYINIYIPAIKRNVQVYRKGKIIVCKR